jgi:integrase
VTASKRTGMAPLPRPRSRFKYKEGPLAPLPRRVELEDDLISELIAPTIGEIRVWDTRLVGFCIRLHPSGRRTFGCKVRQNGRPTWRTIGPFREPWLTAAARTQAAILLAKPLLGAEAAGAIKPSIALHQFDLEKPSALTAMTIAELVDFYLSTGPATRLQKRESSWRTDASGLRRHVVPLIGAKPASDVSKDDISEMCRGIICGRTAITERTRAKGVARVSGGLGAAAVTYRSFKAMMNWALERNLVHHNPANGVRLPRPARRERILTRPEAIGLLEVLDQAVVAKKINPNHADVIRLLLFTGARRMEIMGLRWSEVECQSMRLVLPPHRSKTGGKTGQRIIALSEPARNILLARSPQGEFVFPAAKGNSGHFTGLQKSWVAMRGLAGLNGMRLHDLRHSYACFALEAGENILAISGALGHASTQMTERYLHLREHAATSLAARTAAFILG